MLEILQDLNDLIKNIQIEQNSYVYFNPNSGKIYKIGPKTDDYLEKDYLIVKNTSVTEILSGKKSLSQFVVLFDETEKQYKLKSSETFDTLDYKTFKKISTDIKNKENADIIIVQDFINQEWRVQISDHLYNAFNENFSLMKNLLTFSITEKNDPNILYKCFSKPFFKYFYDLEHVYKGIEVKKWKKEDSHFEGQHVLYKNNVYKILKNQKENTNFSIKNVELIISNVISYDDLNEPNHNIDHILQDNLIYLVKFNKNRGYLNHSIPFSNKFEFNKVPVSIFLSNNFNCFFEVINE